MSGVREAAGKIMIRDRVVGLRRVRASELIPNPKNYRRHPKAQADALRGLLSEVGFADALLVRETPAGLMLIDGHLRAERHTYSRLFAASGRVSAAAVRAEPYARLPASVD